MARSITASENHCASDMELHFRVAAWARGRRSIPEAEDFMTRWGVSYATAHRWRAAWCAANGWVVPPARGPRTRERSTPAATGIPAMRETT